MLRLKLKLGGHSLDTVAHLSFSPKTEVDLVTANKCNVPAASSQVRGERGGGGGYCPLSLSWKSFVGNPLHLYCYFYSIWGKEKELV